MAGIDQEISMRMNAANNNPQLLMQRYAQQGQNVLDLLSAQLLSNQNKAAENSVNAMFQDTPPVINQLEQENAQSAQREVVNALRPGLEMQGQQMANQGIASNPVNNMRMADGGIVGFAGEGPSLVKEKPTMGSVPQNAVSPDQIKIDAGTYESLTTAIANASTPEIKARNQMLLQDLINKMTDENTHALVMQYIDSTKGVVQPRAQGMAGGGIVALKEGGGIISRILDFFRRDKVQPLTEEEVLETMSQYGLDSGYADPRLRDRGRGINRGIMTLRNIEPEETIEETMETMTVPTRAEQFGQRFPGARRAINEAGGSREGGMKYLKMIGEMQAEAEEDEARRALNYIKMMAGSQDMIDDVDPAVNIPTFANGGGVGQAYLDPETGEPLGVGDKIKRLFQGLTGQLTEEDFYQDPDRMTPQELREYPSAAEIRRARYDVPEEEKLTAQELNAMTREEGQQRLVDRALERRGETDVVEGVALGNRVPSKNANLPDPFGVETIIEQLGEVQEEPPEFRMKGVADAGKPDEKGFIDGIDIRRLQAFLAGGAGQASTAGALGGGLRGLMAEDQRAEKMALTERDLMGRIGASRYGAELDYRAAIASLDRQDREMIYKADRELEKQYVGAEQSAARDFLKEIEDDQLFNLQFMRLQSEFEGAALAAETAALKEKMLDNYMGSYRRGGLREDTGSFGYTAPSE